ncbi:MAG: hypothetical protein DRO09_03715, partial [Thermoprotei archaeon]
EEKKPEEKKQERKAEDSALAELEGLISEEPEEKRPAEPPPKRPERAVKEKPEEKPSLTAEIEKLAEEKPEEKKEEFSFEEEEFAFKEEQLPPVKLVFMIYGDKGSGKTSVAMSFPGEIVVLSFDRKAAIIKASRFGNDRRIHVFDVTKYMDYSSSETVCESAEKTFVYINKLLDYVAEKIKPDWIVIDGAEEFQKICEYTMRARHGLTAIEGVKNLNLWKERRLYIRQVHNKALNIAKKGIIYTTWSTWEERIVLGDVVDRRQVPKWIDVLKTESDIILRTEYDPAQRRFYVRVESSKLDSLFPTGKVYDVTDKYFWEVAVGREEVRL